ncbi:MAG: PspC domain-containing protein [Tissierella sp.]|nr:PspC domain-containing protein [Tissierella sp.]
MKRLTRSRSNKVFSGVFAGLGEYFGIDSTILRIIYVIVAFTNPFYALIVYGIAAIIIPEDDGVIYEGSNYNHQSKDNSAMFIGVGLIVLGAVLLARMYLPPFHIIFPNFRNLIRSIRDLWPVLLILLGVFVIFNQKKNH